MATQVITTPAMIKEAVDALAEHGSQVKAAGALGLSRAALQQRLAKHALAVARCSARSGEVGGPPIPEIGRPPAGFAVHRNAAQYGPKGELQKQWVGTKRDAGEVFVVPDGHVVKGESALVDPDGRVLAKWVKTGVGGASGLVDGLLAAFAAYEGAAPTIPPPADTDEDLLTVYPIADLHFGMMAWGEETGANYDTKIAEAMARRLISQLVAQSRPSKHAVILVLGDFYHQNDQKNATPGSGHRLDVDGRWARVFEAGAKLMLDVVDLVAQKHDSVEVVVIPGNHDEDAAVCLRVTLKLFYGANPRIEVYSRPGLHWFRRFGNCLMGASHGHTMKADRMAMMMATDCAKDWGETEHRAMYSGHIHHESAKEVGPVRVESFSTPAPKDAWAAGGGYRSGRAMSAITWHRQDGEIGRHRINISERAAA